MTPFSSTDRKLTDDQVSTPPHTVNCRNNTLVMNSVFVTGLLLLAEQLGETVAPEEPDASLTPPALFKKVGPLVEDWEKYLRNLAEDMDKHHTDSSTATSSTQRTQEDDIFLQVHCLVVDF